MGHRIIFTILLFSLIGLLLPSSFAQTQSIPDWVKNNADWWAQGLISDRDFAAGLGFMVQSKIIKVDNVPIDSEGSIVISDNLSIPKWIRNNADWWAKGAISDDDFKSGIQFMIKEEIVSFKEKVSPNFTSLDNTNIDSKYWQLAFEINKWNEFIALQILEIKTSQASIFKENADDAWDNYSVNDRMEILKQAELFEQDVKQALTDKQKTEKLLILIQQDVTKSKKLALQKIPVLELEKSVSSIQQEIDDVGKIRNSDEINDAYNKVENALRHVEDSIITISGANVGTVIMRNNASLADLYVGDRGMITRWEFQTGSTDDTEFVRIALQVQGSVSAMDIDQSLERQQYITQKTDDPVSIVALRAKVESENAGSQLDDFNVDVNASSEGTETTTGTSGGYEIEESISITVLNIGGKQYPITQFTLWQWDGECDDAWHYHTSTGSAVNLELTGTGDPDPNNCGFGKVSDIPSSTTVMTQNQIDAFNELTGINPAGSDAQMGGSGP